MMARHWRPLIVTLIWLAVCILAVWFSPRPQVPPWPETPAAETLLRAVGLSPEPALLVFHRPGGLLPNDLAYVEGLAQGPLAAYGAVQRYGEPSGESLVLAVTAQPGDIPQLRALLPGDSADLEASVTGTAAWADEAVSSWERSRPWILAVLFALVALVALLGRLGLVRALVIAASAGACGLLTSTLAALFVAPLPLALATVASAGLAAAGAVRLLLGMPLFLRTPYLRPPVADSAPSAEEPAAPVREPSALTRGLILSGETTLLQTVVIMAGLVGFVIDYRAGAALLVGVAVATAASLSLTPALVALLTRPRRTLPAPGKVLRLWARIGLLILPLAGLYFLVPAVRPQDLAARQSEAVAGYELLAAAGAAGDSAVTPARLLPIHLLIQSSAADLEEGGAAVLQGLVSDLRSRPGLAAVEGQVALPPSPAAEVPPQLTAALAQIEGQISALQAALSAQDGELSAAAAGLHGLELSVGVGPIATALDQAGAGLNSVKDSLAGANEDYARIPLEFPEISSRIDHVPTLRRMPETLETAVVKLDDVAIQLRQTITLTRALSTSLAGANGQEVVTGVQAQLTGVQGELQSLVSDTAALRTALEDAAALLDSSWAAQETAVSQGEGDPVAYNLVHLTLVPADGPLAPAALAEAQSLESLVARRLAGGPLADSVVTWGGAPFTAAGQRAQLVPGLLVEGLALAVVALVLAAWGATSRLGVALLLTVGAVVSAAAGVGVAAAVFREIDGGVLVLAAVALVALSAGRLVIGRAPAVEDLVLSLAPLSLLLSAAPALMALGVAVSAGLLVNCFLIVPTLVRRPQIPAPGA